MKMQTIFKIISAILLFEGCSSGFYIDMYGLRFSYPPDNRAAKKKDGKNLSAENRLLVMQNREKANSYIAQGILKSNSNDTNELKLARKFLLASLTFDETRSEVWSYLGEVSLQESKINKVIDKNNKLMDAVFYYNKAIELDSMNNSYYFQRANCYYSIGDSAYLSDYRKACNLGNSKACIIIR